MREKEDSEWEIEGLISGKNAVRQRETNQLIPPNDFVIELSFPIPAFRRTGTLPPLSVAPNPERWEHGRRASRIIASTSKGDD